MKWCGLVYHVSVPPICRLSTLMIYSKINLSIYLFISLEAISIHLLFSLFHHSTYTFLLPSAVRLFTKFLVIGLIPFYDTRRINTIFKIIRKNCIFTLFEKSEVIFLEITKYLIEICAV